LKKGSKYKAVTPRPNGWLPPSVISIEQNIISWVERFSKLCNIASASIEAVKFDTQLLANPEISGVEYQQGTLVGYEIREYLYHKYGHTCQYCNNLSGDKRLEMEHMVSRRNGGSSSIKNLNLACHNCNDEKGSLNLKDWLAKLKEGKQTKLSEARIKNIEKILVKGISNRSLRYSAWVNGYKTKLIKDTKCIISKVELATGGRTSFNRNNLKLPKEHYYDALCVGAVPEKFNFKTNDTLIIKAYGRGSHFRGRTNSCGIITKSLPRQKEFFGFQTGDIVTANVLKGKKTGKYFGRVAVRSSGYFNIQTKIDLIQGIGYKCCKLIQRNDGYSYNIERRTV